MLRESAILGECQCHGGAFNRTRSSLRDTVDQVVVTAAEKYVAWGSAIHLLIMGSGDWQQVVTTTERLAEAGYAVNITAIDSHAFSVDSHAWYYGNADAALGQDSQSNRQLLETVEALRTSKMALLADKLAELRRRYGRSYQVCGLYPTLASYVQCGNVAEAPPEIVTLIDDLTELGGWDGVPVPEAWHDTDCHQFFSSRLHQYVTRLCRYMPAAPLSIVLTHKESKHCVSLHRYDIPNTAAWPSVAEWQTLETAIEEQRMVPIQSYRYTRGNDGAHWDMTEMLNALPLLPPAVTLAVAGDEPDVSWPAVIPDQDNALAYVSVRESIRTEFAAYRRRFWFVASEQKEMMRVIEQSSQQSPSPCELLRVIEEQRWKLFSHAHHVPTFFKAHSSQHALFCEMLQRVVNAVSQCAACDPTLNERTLS